MHRNLKNQTVRIGDTEIVFKLGESIWTESSYKYTLDEFAQLGATAGFTVERVWTVPPQLFSVQYLIVGVEERYMSEVAIPKDAHEVERLRSEIIGWLATTRSDGHPNLAPVWFLWEDPTILIFSQPNKQKLYNIGHNPHVMLGLETKFRRLRAS